MVGDFFVPELSRSEAQELGLSVDNFGARKVVDPIAEVDVTRRLTPGTSFWTRHFEVQWQVAMAKQEAVDVPVAKDILAMRPQPLVLRRLECHVLLATLRTAVPGKPVCEGDAHIWMYPPKGPLEQGCSEDFFDALVAVVARSQSVAVTDHARQAVVRPNDGFAVQLDSKFFLEVAVGPEVVVARMVMDGNAGVGDPRNGSEEPDTALRYGVFVLVPKVEQITHEVNFGGRSFRRVFPSFRGVFQPRDEAQFPFAALGRIGCAEVQVRGEVNAVQGQGLAEQLVELSSQSRSAQVGGNDGALLVHEQRMGNAADAIGT